MDHTILDPQLDFLLNLHKTDADSQEEIADVILENSGDTENHPSLYVNVTRQRYNFNIRGRLYNETIEEYVSKLATLSDLCEFGELQASLVRDRMICDVKDEILREELLNDPDLTLKKTITVCHDWEMKQLQEVHYDDAEIKEEPTEMNASRLSEEEYLMSDDEPAADSMSDEEDGEEDEDSIEATIKYNEDGSITYDEERKPRKSYRKRVTGKYTCDVCGRAVQSQWHLNQHKKSHVKVEKCYSCAICGKDFNQPHKLRLHTQRHTTDRHFPCETCNSAFTTLADLKQHQLTHAIDSKCICHICGKCYVRKYDLKQHTAKKHAANQGIEKPELSCDICLQVFSHPSRLKRHMSHHSDSRLFPCQTCNKEFKSADILKRHEVIHSDSEKYCCHICYKQFNRKEGLDTHVAGTHQGLKPHVCLKCGLAFTWICSLRKHLILHANEKVYQCTLCTKRFNVKWNLTQHMRVHSGDRRYSCSYCSKSFMYKNHLTRHVKTAHMKYIASLDVFSN